MNKWNIKIKAFIGLSLFTVGLGGCTDTIKARLESYGEKQIVCFYSANGTLINKWVSSGKVDSDGSLHVFNDSVTDQYVKVSGSVIVSKTDYCK